MEERDSLKHKSENPFSAALKKRKSKSKHKDEPRATTATATVVTKEEEELATEPAPTPASASDKHKKKKVKQSSTTTATATTVDSQPGASLMSEPAPKKSTVRKEKKKEKKKIEKQQQLERQLEEKREMEEQKKLEESKNEEDDFSFDKGLFDAMNYESPSEQKQKEEKKPAQKEKEPVPVPQPAKSRSFAPNQLNRSKLAPLLNSIKSESEDAQLNGLIELCDFLSIGTEDTMSGFDTNSFAAALVNLLNAEYNPDIMLFACRALCYIMEALPGSSGTIVSQQAVPALVQKLLSIEYIDLAEQALQCLEKISYEQSGSLLSAGGLNAVLMFLDFFAIGTQRSALNTAANICKSVSPESYDLVADAIPILVNLLGRDDAKIMEKALLCLTRLADCFYGTDKLEQLTKNGVVMNLIGLLSAPTTMSPATYTMVLRLLTNLCTSPSVVASLLKDNKGIAVIVQSALSVATGSDTNLSTPISPEQLYEVLSFINELLPQLPEDIAEFLNSNRAPPAFGLRSKGKFNQKKKSSLGSSTESTEQTPEDPKRKLFIENPTILINIGERLLAPLIKVFTTSVNQGVKTKCLMAISKILYFSTADILRELLRNISISSFLANLLSSTEEATVATALRIADVLMEKLSDIFSVYFKREGVLHEVEKLISSKQETKDTLELDANSSADIHQWVQTHAKQFKEKYFAKGSDDESASVHFKRLKSIAADLLARCKVEPTDADARLLEELAKTLSQPENISTFEFLSSSVAEALLTYLTTQPSQNGKESLKERGRLFSHVMLSGKSTGKLDSAMEIEKPPLHSLVLKLHDAFNKLENFPVVLNDVSGLAASGLKALTQPIKLKFQKAEDQEGIKDLSDTSVLVEPLASVNSLIEFLKPRVYIVVSEKPSLNKSTEDMEIEATKEDDKMETKSPDNREVLDEDFENENNDEEEEEEEPFTETVHDLQDIPSNSNSNTNQLNLALSINGQPLSPNMTVFQALQLSLRKSEGKEDSSAPRTLERLWDTAHTVTYTLANVPVAQQSSVGVPHYTESVYLKLLSEPFEKTVDSTEQVYSLLRLIRIIYILNSTWSSLSTDKLALSDNKHYIIPPAEFINNKIAAKLVRQMQDIICLSSGSLPEWSKSLPSTCHFLFPFEYRKLYFGCTSFGIARALQLLQQFSQPGTLRPGVEIRVGRIQRQKVRLARDRILESAMKAIELYGKSKAILEVEYFGEVGTGLGPTLEFYTLASQELQRKDLYLWRDQSPLPKSAAKEEQKDKAENIPPHLKYVNAPGGLFPAPLKKDNSNAQKIIEYFKFMGSFVAKAMLDNRLLDLPLSDGMLKWMTGTAPSFVDLKAIDADLHASLSKFIALIPQIHSIKNNSSLSPSEKQSKLNSITLGGVSIEDIGLDFTLPGHPDWELKSGGSNINVTIQNLEEYVNLVIDATLSSGVSSQLDAFRKGFNEIFSMTNLNVLTSEDLDCMICGHEEPSWDVQTLIENTKCDHGFSHSSKTVRDLLETMSEFTVEERRKFLLFITGSPRLPIGGFKALEPKLTIVRKEKGNEDPDSVLPSVNCCFYYLKLPEYSSKKQLKEKLMFAIEHGQGSFSFN